MDIVSILTLIISIISVTISIISIKLQYSKSLHTNILTDLGDIVFVNSHQKMICAFIIELTNTSNVPIIIKEIGIIGSEENKKDYYDIEYYSPQDDNYKINPHENIDYKIEMSIMENNVKNLILKPNVKNLILYIKCPDGKIYKKNLGNAKAFYKAYFIPYLKEKKYFENL